MRSYPVPATVRYRVDVRGRGAELRCENGRITTTFDGDATSQFDVTFRSRDASAASVDTVTKRPCAGVPLIAPAGGDVASLVDPASPLPASRAPADVRVARALHYRVLSAVLEPLAGIDAYHLTIRALAAPARYPLTDLWVDPAGDAIRRVRGVFADTFGGAPATITATGDFAQVGSAWFLVREHVDFDAATLPRATHAVLDATATAYDVTED